MSFLPSVMVLVAALSELIPLRRHWRSPSLGRCPRGSAQMADSLGVVGDICSDDDFPPPGSNVASAKRSQGWVFIVICRLAAPSHFPPPGAPKLSQGQFPPMPQPATFPVWAPHVPGRTEWVVCEGPCGSMVSTKDAPLLLPHLHYGWCASCRPGALGSEAVGCWASGGSLGVGC